VALLDAGVRGEEIQTSQYRLSIPTESKEVILIKALAGGNQTLEYVATSSVKEKMNVSEDVGKIQGAAIAAGSNRVRSVTYSRRDSEPQKDESLAKAVADARRKTEIMGSSAGVELGRVLDINEGYSYYWEASVGEVAFEAEGTTAGLSVPLQPTDVTVQAKVEIVYELVQPES